MPTAGSSPPDRPSSPARGGVISSCGPRAVVVDREGGPVRNGCAAAHAVALREASRSGWTGSSCSMAACLEDGLGADARPRRRRPGT